jgi:hypothetical protein
MPRAAAGKTVVIPPKANHRLPGDYDHYIYEVRHPIENFFAKLTVSRSNEHHKIAACDARISYHIRHERYRP